MSWATLTAAVACYTVAVFAASALSYGALSDELDHLESATHGWVSRLLILPLAALSFTVLIAIVGGRLTIVDLGWRWSALPAGLVLTVVGCLCMQGVVWLMDLFARQTPTFAWRWGDQKMAVLATLNAEWAGNSLTEETMFRGLLLPQLFLIFTNAARGWVALVIAVLVSSTLYAASHIPALLLDPYNELGLIKPLWLIVALGIMLAIAFIVTRNLFICIGMHSLWNARALVIEASDERARAAWWIASSLLVLVWLVASTGVISIRARKNVMQ